MKPQQMPNHLRPTVLPVARHEAGHIIIGRLHGFWSSDCSATILRLNGDYRGGAEIQAGLFPDLNGRSGWLSRTSYPGLCAGALAESLSPLGKVDRESATERLKIGAMDDCSRARELIHLLRNIQQPESNKESDWQAALHSINSRIWDAAAACVEAEHRLIQGLAGRLADALMEVGLGATAIGADEINSMPAIVERFGPHEPCAT